MKTYEAAIIGAGPIGIEAAVALSRAGVSHVQIEAGEIGATMGWWAPGTRYFSSPERIAIAGVPLVVQGEEKASREDYMRYLRQVAAQFNLPIRTFERVVGVEREDGAFVLRTVRSGHGVGGEAEQRRHDGAPPGSEPALAAYRAERVILAIGNMHRPRLIEVPGEGLPHVSHYLEDPHRYFGQRVVIVGGRNSAVEGAIRLHRAGARVTMIQRRPELEHERIKYWLLPELRWLIKKGMIDFLPRTCVSEITPELVRAASDDGTVHEVGADAVLLLTGYVQNGDLFEMLGVERRGEEERPVHDHETMETNVPGVYVAGTAVGGSQRRAKVFVENAHEHVERIVRAIAGRDVDVREPAVYEGNEES